MTYIPIEFRNKDRYKARLNCVEEHPILHLELYNGPFDVDPICRDFIDDDAIDMFEAITRMPRSEIGGEEYGDSTV